MPYNLIITLQEEHLVLTGPQLVLWWLSMRIFSHALDTQFWLNIIKMFSTKHEKNICRSVRSECSSCRVFNSIHNLKLYFLLLVKPLDEVVLMLFAKSFCRLSVSCSCSSHKHLHNCVNGCIPRDKDKKEMTRIFCSCHIDNSCRPFLEKIQK